jgi:DNA-binding IclR family transcriptional regulator
MGGSHPPVIFDPRNIKRLELLSKSDQALLAVMRANPGASLADLIRLGRRSRTSTVLSLKRLEEAGLVEHPSKGQYSLSTKLRHRSRLGSNP